MENTRMNDPFGSEDEGYRRCSECGGDCDPEPSALDSLGVRITFVCPEHGPQSIVDPFQDQR